MASVVCPKCASRDTLPQHLALLGSNGQALAEGIERPRARSVVIWIVAVGILAVATLAIMVVDPRAALLLGLFAATAGMIGYSAHSYNRHRLPVLIEQWGAQFICGRCGARFSNR